MGWTMSGSRSNEGMGRARLRREDDLGPDATTTDHQYAQPVDTSTEPLRAARLASAATRGSGLFISAFSCSSTVTDPITAALQARSRGTWRTRDVTGAILCGDLGSWRQAHTDQVVGGASGLGRASVRLVAYPGQVSALTRPVRLSRRYNPNRAPRCMPLGA